MIQFIYEDYLMMFTNCIFDTYYGISWF